MPFPAQIEVEALKKQHPALEDCCEDLELYGALSTGGRVLKRMASTVLVKKDRESNEMWSARQRRFEPDSPLATATTFYASKLFANEPTVDFGRPDENTDGEEKSPLSATQEAFWDHFKDHADGGSKRLVDAARDVFCRWAAYGWSWTLIDRPVDAGSIQSLADNSNLSLAPYLVDIPATDVLNWDEDDDGLLLVVVKADRIGALELATGEHRQVPAWKVYDRTGWALYEHQEKKEKFARKVDEGAHALTKHGRVPIIRMDAPGELWLADRAAGTTCGYLNLDNEISMYLQSGMLIKQYIKTSDFEGAAKASNDAHNAIAIVEIDGEVGYIEINATALGPAEQRLDRKRDAVFRLCHLMPAARGTQSVSDQAQSGESKKMDYELTTAVMEGYGDLEKRWYAAVVESVFLAAGYDAPEVGEVRGFRFVPSDLKEAVDALESVKAQGIQSDILIESLECDVADRALADKPEDKRVAAKKQILDGAKFSVRQEQAQAEAAKSMAGAFGGV